mmetsp:Transcript_87779/g.160935  ORF Transcript_87779/g.160935 Transcript_87779/m.160935 type:complete len:241 (+) Transcript_87779:394-1116(+)
MGHWRAVLGCRVCFNLWWLVCKSRNWRTFSLRRDIYAIFRRPVLELRRRRRPLLRSSFEQQRACGRRPLRRSLLRRELWWPLLRCKSCNSLKSILWWPLLRGKCVLWWSFFNGWPLLQSGFSEFRKCILRWPLLLHGAVWDHLLERFFRWFLLELDSNTLSERLVEFVARQSLFQWSILGWLVTESFCRAVHVWVFSSNARASWRLVQFGSCRFHRVHVRVSSCQQLWRPLLLPGAGSER